MARNTKVVKRAGCTNKIKYAYPAQAEKRRKEMKLKGNAGLQVYKCEFCRQWHIGHTI